MNFKKIIFLFFFGLLSAKVSLTLTSAVQKKIPLALQGSGEFFTTIARDLERSGWVDLSDAAPVHRYRIEGKCVYPAGSPKPMLCVEGPAPRAAHALSDRIFERVTGVKGWFSSKVVFVSATLKSYKNRTYRLEVSDAWGENAQVVFSSQAPIMSPAWSPDGRSLAYVSFEGGRPSLWRQDLASGRRDMLSQAPGINGAPAWAPDGQSLALVLSQNGTPKIYVLNLATRSLKQLTHGSSLDTEPCWHPSGQALFYTSNRGGQPQIYRLSLSNGASERVTYAGDYNATASLSADGKRLVTLSRENGKFRVLMHDLTGARPARVLSNQGSEEQPMLHAGGEVVLYGVREGGSVRIMMTQADLSWRHAFSPTAGWWRFASWSKS